MKEYKRPKIEICKFTVESDIMAVSATPSPTADHSGATTNFNSEWNVVDFMEE